MYRNCVYDSKKGECVLFKWDEMGKRVKESFSYFPYYYVETFNDAKSDAVSIFGTKLKKRVFKNQYERSESVKGFISNRVFYNLGCEHQFLIDHFNNTPEFKDFDEFSKNPLKIFFWDIEVYTPAGCGFPEPEDANFPIDLMTIYDSIEKKYFVWGLKPYETDRDDVVFIHCKTEKDLLRKFVKFWISDYPDVLTAWNLDFDLNYTINRLRKLFGKDSHEILSPVEKIYEKTKINKFKQPVETYVIKGISQLDYIDVYKKFNPTQKPSYKLDDIAEEELGENKVDFDGSLAELSDNDWNTYVEYNIKDVELVKKLDDNLEYMAIIKQLAYMGLCGIEDALGTIKNVDGVIAIEALKHGKIIPTFVSGGGSRFEGAYVKDPVRGLSEYVVSYDLNSLYPSILITLNASPETKVGEILSRSDGVVTISFVNGKNYELSEEKFQQFIKSKNIAISSANILFDQNNKGLIPDIVDRIYQDRVAVKAEMKRVKTEIYELEKLLSMNEN